MTASSDTVCDELFQAALWSYFYAISASVLFSAVALGLYFMCLKARLDGAPTLAAQYFFMIGSFKVLFAVGIWVGFQPQCPDGCSCKLPLPIYPVLALLIGLRWIAIGREHLLLSRVVASEGEDKDGPIFDAVSTVEMA